MRVFKKIFRHWQDGFTLPEVIVTMGILGVIFGFITVRALGVQQKPQLSTAVTTLVTDLRQQQLKAMTGDTGGSFVQNSYGIYFEPTQYTLFHGASYNMNDGGNVIITFSSPLRFSSIQLPNNIIVFTKGSGEVSNFVSNQSSVTLQNTLNSETKIITINRLGTVISVQ